jgi:hypothetical protein
MDVIRDGNHALKNVREEDINQLPTRIDGICPCGARGLYIKVSPFDPHTIWYLCTGCHWQIDCWWNSERSKFQMIREVLFLAGQQAPIPDEMAKYARKLLGEHPEGKEF